MRLKRVGMDSRIGRIVRHLRVQNRRLWLGSILLLGLLPAGAAAITTISHGYATKEALPLGSIVSLKENTSDQVIAAISSNVDSLLGVVINDGSSLLTVSNNQEAQVQIATSGIVGVLVSDINGPISQGDQITASPIKGVGMRATSNVKVIGIAQGSPEGGTDERHAYTDDSGNEQSVALGQVPVLVNVAYYFKQPEQTIIPSTIQKLANALAGKKVDPLPVILATAIFVITMIVVVSIIYSMIKSSIISVGRNPMSQSAIYRDLIQISALVLGILSVGVVVIYLVLTRL